MRTELRFMEPELNLETLASWWKQAQFDRRAIFKEADDYFLQWLSDYIETLESQTETLKLILNGYKWIETVSTERHHEAFGWNAPPDFVKKKNDAVNAVEAVTSVLIENLEDIYADQETDAQARITDHKRPGVY